MCEDDGVSQIPRSPITVVGATVAGLMCGFGLLVQYFRMHPRDAAMSDLVQEWASARNHVAGTRIYGELKPTLEREGMIVGQRALPVNSNGHPPVAVLLTLPLGRLDFASAQLVWNRIAFGCALIGFWLILGRFGLRAGFVTWLTTAAILLFSAPFAQDFVQGQWNCILLMLIAMGWVGLRHRRDTPAGIALGTAAAIKLFPAFLLLVPLMQKRWKAIGVGGLTIVVWHAAAWWVLGHDTLVDYATVIVPGLRSYQDWWLNASLTGYFRRLTFPTSGHNVGFANNAYLCYSLIAGSIVLVTLLAAKQCRPVAGDSRDERNVIDRSFATCVIANLLVSPITWDHYFLLLSLPTLILWHSAECVRVRVILLSMIAIMAANPSWIWNPLIAGDHELAALWGGEPSVATAWQTVSLIAYPCYTLVALFVFTLLSGRANSISSMVEGGAAAGNGVNEKRAATTVAAR